MEDKTFRIEDDGSYPIVDLGRIKDPVSRKRFEEMERLQRELEYFNRKAEEELRQAGLI
jgi:hypothetical protein